MRAEEKDFLTLVQDTLAAMKQGEYVFDSGDDIQTPDRKGNIVVSQAFENMEVRLLTVGKMISTIFLKRLLTSERSDALLKNDFQSSARIFLPQSYDFAVTRYKGGVAFFFRIPDDVQLDFEQAEKDFQDIKKMFTPQPIVTPYVNLRNDLVKLGPFSHSLANEFLNHVACIAQFHDQRQGVPMKMMQNGTDIYSVFKRDDYAEFIRNDEIIKKLDAATTAAKPPGPERNWF